MMRLRLHISIDFGHNISDGGTISKASLSERQALFLFRWWAMRPNNSIEH
jgi:hypothetical protein